MDSVQHVWLDRNGAAMIACEHSIRRWQPAPPPAHGSDVNPGKLETIAELIGTALRNTGSFLAPVQDRTGSVWLADSYNNIVRISGAVQYTYPAIGKLAHLANRGLCVDSNGSVWIAADGGIYQAVNGKLDLVIPAQELGGFTAWRIVGGRDGDVWVHANNTVYRIHNHQVHKIGAKDGITDDVTYLSADNTGAVWAQDIDVRRLHMWDGHRFQDRLTPEPICWAWACPIYQDHDGGIWLGTYGGLCGLRHTACRTFNKSDGLTSENVRSLCVDAGGRVWAGTDFGDLYSFHDGVFTSVNDKTLARKSITAIAADADGSLWTVASGGLFNVLNGHARSMATAIGLTNREYVQSLTIDKSNTVWLGTPSDIMKVQPDCGREIFHHTL